MSKPDRLAYGVMVSGVTLGYIVGGRAGLIFSALGLVAGLGFLIFIVASTPKGVDSTPGDAAEAYSSQEETRILILVRDFHARAQHGVKTQDILAADQSSFDFDVFINVWLVSETDFPLSILHCQLNLTSSTGSTVFGKLVHGDLENWSLGGEKEEWDLWDTYTRASREPMPELNLTEQLLSGDAREGWLHFQIPSVSPSELRTGPMEFWIEDSLSHTHVRLVDCHRNLPGKVWPGPQSEPRSAVA